MAAVIDLHRASSLLNGRKPEDTTYVGNSASDHSRQHNGNNYNNYSYNYTLRQRRSDGSLRESQRDHQVLKASANGHTPRVQHLISLSVSRNHTDDDGLTALHHAALSGFDDTVDVLIQAGWDVDADSQYGHPLCLAAFKSRLNVVETLIRYRADVHETSTLLGTCLHVVSLTGDVKVALALLRHQIVPDKEAVLPLAVACGAFNILPATVNGTEPGHEAASQCTEGALWTGTALSIAIRAGHDAIVEALLQNGACPRRLSPSLISSSYVMQEALLTPLMLAALGARPGIVKLLLQHGAGPDDQIAGAGFTALMYATVAGSYDCLVMLLQHGAAHNLTSDIGWSALHYAADQGELRCVQALIDASADVDALNAKARTALREAAYKGQFECVLALLGAGADANAADKYSRTPLHETTVRTDGASQRVDIVAALLQAGANINAATCSGGTPLHVAVEKGNEELVKCIIRAGANLDCLDGKGWSPLMLSTHYGHVSSAVELIRAGADVNAKRLGSTTLHIAAYHGHVEVVKVLLQAGAQVEALDRYASTPLYKAVTRGHEACVEELLGLAADPETSCYDTNKNRHITALYAAADAGHAKILRRLLTAGASVDKDRSRKGEKRLYPIAAAARNGCLESVELLWQAGAQHAVMVAEAIRWAKSMSRDNICSWLKKHAPAEDPAVTALESTSSLCTVCGEEV